MPKMKIKNVNLVECYIGSNDKTYMKDSELMVILKIKDCDDNGR